MFKAHSHDGTTLAYDRLGHGPAVIIVGGAFTDRQATRPLADLLAAELTVFNYDRRGRGDSGDTMPYAIEREIEDISTLITEAGGSAAVYGHSSGAALAIEAARVLPGITRLALYEPPFIVDGSRPPLPDDYVNHLHELTAADKREEIVEYFMTVAVGLPAEYVTPMRDSDMWPYLTALAPTAAYDGAATSPNMMGKPLPATWADEITIPTLVLNGDNSPAWQRDSVKALAELLPAAARHSLPGVDHTAPPEQLAPVLATFLR